MSDFEKDFSRRKSILFALLFYALDDAEEKELPVTVEYLTSEIASAIDEKVTGEFSDLGFYKEITGKHDIVRANRKIIELIRETDFPERFKEDLREIIVFKFGCGYGEQPCSNLVSILFFGLLHLSRLSSFMPELERKTCELEKEDKAFCEEIGRKMSGYIKQDIEDVRRKDVW